MPATTIGIDIGSINIRVYVKNKGVTLKEPSIAAYDKDIDKYIAYGEEARQVIGHASGNIVGVRPFRHGSISDYAVLEEVLRYFIQKALGRRGFRKPDISLCVPSDLSDVEKRAIEEASYQAGARSVTMMADPVAAAIGAGIDITKPVGNLVADIGGGPTKVALISVGSPVIEDTIMTGGKTFDDAIMRHIRKRHSLFINESQAEAVKISIANVYKRTDNEKTQVKGRNVITGLPQTIEIRQDEIRKAIKEPAERIVESIHGVLEKTPPELAADVVSRGIVLTGGGALLGGLEELIAHQTGINVMTAENPSLCVVKGVGRYNEVMEMLGK